MAGEHGGGSFASRAKDMVVLTILVLVPFAAAPERLAHPAPWVIWAAAALTFLTQPPLPDLRAMRDDPLDRGSILAILVAGNLFVVASSAIFALRPALKPPAGSGWVLVGVALIALGFAVRIAAIRGLGRSFTNMVAVAPGQRVVDTGVFKHVRHPSYLGVLIGMLGMACLIESPVLFVALLAGVVPVYEYRIRVEEVALVSELGDAYRDYQRRSRKLIPLLH